MKNTFLTSVFILVIGISFSMAQTQDEKNLKFTDKSNLKGASKNTNTKPEDKNQEIKKDEPVIIQTLEYTAPGYTPIKTEDTKKENIPSENKTEEEVEYVDPITAIDNNIQAIDTKVEWVKNNPEEDKKAKANGWYVQMEEHKTALMKKKQELTNSGK